MELRSDKMLCFINISEAGLKKCLFVTTNGVKNLEDMSPYMKLELIFFSGL